MKTFRLHDAEDHISDAAIGRGGRIVPQGTILLLVRGMTLHNDVPICVITRDMAFNQDIKAIEPGSGVDGQFLAYWLLAHKPDLLASVDHAGHGTGRLVTDTLKQKPVLLPSLGEQKAIVSVLAALDDKIELNRRMNVTLEAMARALFKSWFVDFDPVRAKLDGRLPTGLDAATAALFPATFADTDLGCTPSGWEVRGLDKAAHYLNGLALQKFPPKDGPTLPVVKIAQLRRGDTVGADRCNTSLPKEYVVQDGDVLFSWSGSLEVELWCGGEGALNQHLFKVTSSEFPKWFYYLWTLHHLDEFRLIAADKATTMGHIQRGHLSSALVLIPPRPLLDAMTRLMSPVIDQIIANRIQFRTLATLRDTLLPKLLSGEVRVSVSDAAPGVCHTGLEQADDQRDLHQPPQTEFSGSNVIPFPDAAVKRTTDEFVEAVLIARLVKVLAKPEYPVGRFRYNKFAYLAHRKVEDDTTKHYLKKAAGPYSPWAKYSGPENIAKRNGYIREANVDGRKGFLPADKIDKIEPYAVRYPVCDAVEWVVSRLRFRKNDELEVLATVDFAAVELVAESEALTLENVKRIIATNTEWAPKLNREIFSDEKIAAALVELATLYPALYKS